MFCGNQTMKSCKCRISGVWIPQCLLALSLGLSFHSEVRCAEWYKPGRDARRKQALSACPGLILVSDDSFLPGVEGIMLGWMSCVTHTAPAWCCFLCDLLTWKIRRTNCLFHVVPICGSPGMVPQLMCCPSAVESWHKATSTVN